MMRQAKTESLKYRGDETICWYDSWSHPEIPALASTFPHHRHSLPNLRDHRVPAPGIRFDAPNLVSSRFVPETSTHDSSNHAADDGSGHEFGEPMGGHGDAEADVKCVEQRARHQRLVF